MSYFTGIVTWIGNNWQLIGALFVAIIVFIITRKYYLATCSNDALLVEIARRNAMQKEKDRIEAAAHELENNLPKDKPSEKPSGELPPTIIVCLAIIILFNSCSSSPVIVKPELPKLQTYNAVHIPVTFHKVDNNYCTDKESFNNFLYNDAEYKRVIANYETEIQLYNEFLKTYYLTPKNP